MKSQPIHFALLLLAFVTPAPTLRAQEPVAKRFLRYVYGAEGIDLATVCRASSDVWMLRGKANPEAQRALDAERIEDTRDGIVSGVLGRNLYFVEVRDGLVDPAFALDGVYLIQRRVVHGFLYACLAHDMEQLRGLTTDAGRVFVDGPTPGAGDMDVYASVIDIIPVIRSSAPADDARSRAVTYRVPLGAHGLSLTLVRDGNAWKVDTSKGVHVSLEYFFR